MACVLRRGPSAWCHVALWRVDDGAVLHGAWLRATLYPERSAVSPDGRLLAAFVHDGRASRPWQTYFAVSRAPWLHALAAWETAGTWTTGAHFESGTDLLLAGGCLSRDAPDHGTFPGSVTFAPVDTRWVRARLFRELRTGWTEAAGEEPWLKALPAPLEAHPDAVVVSRPGPEDEGGDGRRLVLVSLQERQREYYLVAGGAAEPLEDVRCAEWGPGGSVLAATTSGHLRVLERDGRVAWEYDMNRVEPDPRPAPPWATSW